VEIRPFHRNIGQKSIIQGHTLYSYPAAGSLIFWEVQKIFIFFLFEGFFLCDFKKMFTFASPK